LRNTCASSAEGNVERGRFYELLWEVGAAQTDAVMLTTSIDGRAACSYELQDR
jgi:hypothetical protein